MPNEILGKIEGAIESATHHVIDEIEAVANSDQAVAQVEQQAEAVAQAVVSDVEKVIYDGVTTITTYFKSGGVNIQHYPGDPIKAAEQANAQGAVVEVAK